MNSWRFDPVMVIELDAGIHPSVNYLIEFIFDN